MVEKVQLGKVFLRLLRFSPASVITLTLRTHFTDHATLYQDKQARPANLQSKQGAFDNKRTSRYQTAVTLFLWASENQFVLNSTTQSLRCDQPSLL
jgi:hypothetical protein